MNDLVNLSLGEMITALRAGEVSSRELTQAYLERIDHLDSSIHAYLTLTPDDSITQADEADRKIRVWRSEPDQPLPGLTGVPIAVKDVLCVKDVRCTCGSRRTMIPSVHLQNSLAVREWTLRQLWLSGR